MPGIILKRKIKIVIIIVLVLVLLIPIIWLGVSFAKDKSKYRMVENYYYSNTESFNEISSYFKNLYSEGLYRVQFPYTGDFNKIALYQDDNDDRTTTTSSEKNVYDENFVSVLANLRNKYQANSEYPIFSNVRAYFDKDGDMQLIINAYSEPLKTKGDINTPDTRNIYLVYCDEGYDGECSFIGIGSSDDIKPFSDRWCTWSAHDYLG